jgi:hypothetical protein
MLLDSEIAEWVEGLKQATGLSEAKVIEDLLEILRVAVSIERQSLFETYLKSDRLRFPCPINSPCCIFTQEQVFALVGN